MALPAATLPVDSTRLADYRARATSEAGWSDDRAEFDRTTRLDEASFDDEPVPELRRSSAVYSEPAWHDLPLPPKRHRHSMTGRIDGIQFLLQSVILMGLLVGTMVFLIGLVSTAENGNEDAPREPEAPTLRASR